MSYNGWKNYETWNVALWIDNDEGSYTYAREQLAEIRDETEPEYTWQNKTDAVRYAAAEWLKDWVTEEMVPDLGASLAADLLGAALSEVDWQEIVDNWLPELEEQEA